MDIPIFFECTHCKRSFINTSSMWADKDKHICACCECFGFDIDKPITLCQRTKCKLYKYLDRDFILESEVPSTEEEMAVVIDPEYSDESNKCYRCRKELTAFLYLNGKATSFDMKGDIEARGKLKLKLCAQCAKEFFKYLPINLIKEIEK